MVSDKQVVKEGERARWTRKPGLPEVTASWHNYMRREVVRDFQQTMLHCSEAPYEEEAINSIPTEPFEFPTGYNNVGNFFTPSQTEMCFVVCDVIGVLMTPFPAKFMFSIFQYITFQNRFTHAITITICNSPLHVVIFGLIELPFYLWIYCCVVLY